MEVQGSKGQLLFWVLCTDFRISGTFRRISNISRNFRDSGDFKGFKDLKSYEGFRPNRMDIGSGSRDFSDLKSGFINFRTDFRDCRSDFKTFRTDFRDCTPDF